jgi:F-type H+-transporting ATPase subunit a
VQQSSEQISMQDKILPGLPLQIPYVGSLDYGIVFWSAMVALLVALLGWWLGRKLRKYPGRRQAAAEMLVGWFDGLCRDVLGPSRGRKYLPLFGSLFLFLVVANTIGIVPLGRLEIGGEPYRDFNNDGAWQPGEPAVAFGEMEWDRERSGGFVIPAVMEPTRNVNVPMGLSLFLAAGMYLAAIILKGLRGFPGSLFRPFWWMFPLNLIGVVAQVASVSFRLFGNIFGTAVITVIVSGFLYSILVPIPLNIFLGLGFGLIQAFVFTMLWITYHSELVAEEG